MAEGLSLANFIPYLFVLRLSENTEDNGKMTQQ